MAALTTKNKYIKKSALQLSIGEHLYAVWIKTAWNILTLCLLDPLLGDLIVSVLKCIVDVSLFIYSSGAPQSQRTVLRKGWIQPGEETRVGQNENDAFASLPCIFSVYMCVQSKQPADTDVPVAVTLDTQLSDDAVNYNWQASNNKIRKNRHVAWFLWCSSLFSLESKKHSE